MITRRRGLSGGVVVVGFVVGGLVVGGLVVFGWGLAGGCALVGPGNGNGGSVDGMTQGSWGMIVVPLGRVVGAVVVGGVPVVLGVAGGFAVVVGRG